MNMKRAQKRLTALLLAGLLLLTVGCGGQKSEPEVLPPVGEAAELPEAFPMKLYYSSGAGAWRTELTLEQNGDFTGTYSDADADTMYFCEFKGSFTDIRKLDSETYSLTLESLTALTEEGREWDEDGVHYIGSTPYGMEPGTDFRLYTPEKAAPLPDSPSGDWPSVGTDSDTLDCYALHNLTENNVFYDWSYWFPEEYSYKTVDPRTLTWEIPEEYLPQLIINTELEDNTEHWVSLLTVHEKASVEAAQRDWGDGNGIGFLFGIAALDQVEFERYLMADASGVSLFAKGKGWYYVKTFPTDVQYYRSNDTIDMETEDWASWVELNALGDTVCQDFITRNGLEAYTNDDYYAQFPFTWEGDHAYAKYYHYYTFDGSLDEYYTLVLSQPAGQGEGGIWCVERIYDYCGNQMLYFPDTGIPNADYYAEQQHDCDAGQHPELLTPLGAAKAFVEDSPWFSDEASDLNVVLTDGIDSDYTDTNANMQRIVAGLLYRPSTISEEELLECVSRFSYTTWGVMGRSFYGSDWWTPLQEALERAAVGDNQSWRDDRMMEFYFTAYGPYAKYVAELLQTQQQADPAAFDAALTARTPDEQAVIQAVLDNIST